MSELALSSVEESPVPVITETPIENTPQTYVEEKPTKKEDMEGDKNKQKEEQNENEDLKGNDEEEEDIIMEPPPSAIKGKSGRERSTEMKLRFNPDITVMETPNYFLVMNSDEGEDEVAELAVFDRLYEEAKKRVDRAKAEALKTKESEDNLYKTKEVECTFKPVVSDAAKNLGRYSTWDEFLRSQEERRKTSAMHFQKKKDKIHSDEIVPLFEDMPRKHSRNIITYLEKERKYKGPIKGWRGRFRAYMERLQQQEQEGGVSSLLLRSKSNNDSVSVHSGIIRDDKVFDRLYEEALVREAAQRVVLMTQLEKEARELYHPITNESEYWNNNNNNDNNNSSNSSSESGGQHAIDRSSYPSSFLYSGDVSNSNSNVFEYLYNKGTEYRRRREQRAEAAVETQEEFSFHPNTNPQSRRIIMQRAIARAKGELPERRRNQTTTEMITESPHNQSQTRFNPDIFCSRLQRKESERLRRIALLRQQQYMEEASACTFRPFISRNSHAMAIQKGYGHIVFTPQLISSPTNNSHRHYVDGDGENNRGSKLLHRERISQQHQQEEEKEYVGVSPLPPAQSGSSKSNKSNAGPAVNIFNNKTAKEKEGNNYISNLSTEIQDLLSEWKETAEDAKTAA